jgi:hypothetical protein
VEFWAASIQKCGDKFVVVTHVVLGLAAMSRETEKGGQSLEKAGLLTKISLSTLHFQFSKGPNHAGKTLAETGIYGHAVNMPGMAEPW